ncbi:MAG TPA: hypothetical protein VLA97_02765 [Nocardioidaceae bacterium]|nr:hypothetical protein [Nocardioidaceae bacterium]
MYFTIPGRSRTDEGSAMVITLMVMALVSALATTVAVVTINNLQSSWRAQQAGAALGAADAGVAQAVAYLRTSGVRDLGCSPACTTNAWGRQADPVKVTVPGVAGQKYQVWIEAVAPFPANDPGRYRIHSTGTAAGDASRSVRVDVEVSPIKIPRGIFARTIDGGGGAVVKNQSIFSTGCVYDRDKIEMSGTDEAYGIPAAVHSSQIITEATGSGQFCEDTNSPIHRTGHKNADPKPCPTDADYKYDQDKLGGSLTGTTCESVQTTYPDYYGLVDVDKDGTPDVKGSWIEDEAALFGQFNIRTPALGDAQIDALRTTAQSQGNYWTAAAPTDASWKTPDEKHAVMFFDLAKTDLGGTVDLNQIQGFSRGTVMSTDPAACPSKSLVIVIDGGNAKLNSNQELVASLFLTSPAPLGQVKKANGTSTFIGTIYADTINLVGTADVLMDTCFHINMSPSLLDVEAGSYLEVDRGLS